MGPPLPTTVPLSVPRPLGIQATSQPGMSQQPTAALIHPGQVSLAMSQMATSQMATGLPGASQPSTFKPSWLQMQAAAHAKPTQVRQPPVHSDPLPGFWSPRGGGSYTWVGNPKHYMSKPDRFVSGPRVGLIFGGLGPQSDLLEYGRPCSGFACV